MMIKEAIASLMSGKSLAEDTAATVMEEIMDGQTTPSQLSAFIVALRIKGETTEEISGLARTMRSKAIPVHVSQPVVDIVGTGGDMAGTFNISTTAALVAAGAGLRVAKHGNRAASGKCGSADVLEELGVRLNLSGEKVTRCIEELGIAFMFAPAFHPAMKYAAPTRREIGVPTVFNILGPLTNPAGARAQVLGVARASLVEKMALVLKNLGYIHALVVHGEDGLDEITITGSTIVCELKEGVISSYSICPQDFGLQRAEPASLTGGDAVENAAILRRILNGEHGPKRDIVLMNTAAALLAGDMVQTLEEGVLLAEKALDSGRAMEKLERLIKFTQELENG
jgi:anthranilate phosphoribosyltransferase